MHMSSHCIALHCITSHHLTQLDQARFELERKQRDGDFVRAGQLKYEIIPKLQKQVEHFQADASMMPGLSASIHICLLAFAFGAISLHASCFSFDLSVFMLIHSACIHRTRMHTVAVTAEDVAFVISRSTGIPIAKLLVGERERLLQMERELQKRVIGLRASHCSLPSALLALSICGRCYQ